LRGTRARAITDLQFTWRSSDSTIAHVSHDGVVTAVAPGSAQIRAELAAGAAIASPTRTVNVVLTSPVGGPLLGAAIPCAGMAGPFPCDRIDLLSFLPVSGVGGVTNVDLNDIWGWTDPLTNKEYAIVMRRDGTAFVDVSDPVNPAYLGYLPIPTNALVNVWHDVKVYADHAFIVADAAGAHGMQVFDLRRLREHAGVPRTFAATTTYRNVNSAHNIAINEATGFAYIVGASGGGNTCGGGLHMVDIRVPAAPSFAGCFADPFTGRLSTGYTHDVQCVRYTGPDAAFRDREVCFGSNETHLSIADVSDKSAPVAIGRASYPQSA
jgi:choice-of-anchor B domain-containing protein